jgi:hypothetical protein
MLLPVARQQSTPMKSLTRNYVTGFLWVRAVNIAIQRLDKRTLNNKATSYCRCSVFRVIHFPTDISAPSFKGARPEQLRVRLPASIVFLTFSLSLFLFLSLTLWGPVLLHYWLLFSLQFLFSFWRGSTPPLVWASVVSSALITATTASIMSVLDYHCPAP